MSADPSLARVEESAGLVNCPDCGQSVSRQAKRCPQCGRPLAKISKTAVLSIAVSVGALVAATSLKPFVYVPLVIAAVLLARRAVRRGSTDVFASRGILRAVVILATASCLVAACALVVVGPSVANSRKAHADAVVQADLSSAATAQEIFFEEEGEYTRDVYGLKIANGWTVTDWDYYEGGISFSVNPGMYTQRVGNKPGYCMVAQSVSGKVFHYDSDAGAGEGSCPELLDPLESTSDSGTPSDSTDGASESQTKTDAAFCELVSPFVNDAIDLEFAARAGDRVRYREATDQLLATARRWKDQEDEFSDVKAYADAFETYDFYLDRVSQRVTPYQWNQLRRSSGSHLTRGLVLRSSYTCPDYAAVSGL